MHTEQGLSTDSEESAAEIPTEPFPFTDLPFYLQLEIVEFLDVSTWAAFMQTSKASRELAFYSESAARIVMVLLNLTSLEGASLELILAHYRASPAFQSLVEKITHHPEKVRLLEWIAYQHSVTTLDELNVISYEHYLASFVRYANSALGRKEITQFIAAGINMIASLRDNNEGLQRIFFQQLRQNRMTAITQPLPDFSEFSQMIATLKSLPHPSHISDELDMMILHYAGLLDFFNGLGRHERPLPRLFLMGLSYPDANLSQLDLCCGNLQHANLERGLLNELFCRYANFRYANLASAHLGNADFYAADLRDANLRKAFFMLGHLSQANLSGANLRYAYFGAANLREAIFFHADMRHAEFPLANLQNARLTQSDMRFTKFYNADLSGALLIAVNLAATVMLNVNLTGADLTGANLMGAQFNQVDLSRAILVGVNFEEATFDRVRLAGAIVLGLTKAHLLDIEQLQARLDGVFDAMLANHIPKKIHRQFRDCAAHELVACVEAHAEISPAERIHCLEAVIQHPIFTRQHLNHSKKVLNKSFGLFSQGHLVVKSASQRVIADCLAELRRVVSDWVPSSSHKP